MNEPLPNRPSTHPRLKQARLRMIGSLRLRLFARQVVEPVQDRHLVGLATILDETRPTRHAVDAAVARWQRDWREGARPLLIEQAVATLAEDEAILELRADGAPESEPFERLAAALAAQAIDACLPRLRSGAERLRRVRLSVR